MDQEQEQIEQTAEQDNADFLSGFNAVRPDDAQALPEQKASGPEPAADDAPGKTEGNEESGEPETEEPTYFGLSESQIKSLLERSAQVDEIRDQLRKAHGKIGELNSTVQNLSQQRRPTQDAPAAQVDASGVSEWEKDFPELAQLAEEKARKIIAETLGNREPDQAFDRDAIVRETNLAIMDANHDGWRETVNSQDFSLWIATQPADVQETFNTTVSARALGGILSSFENWKNKTSDRASKNKARLEQALIPSGGAARATHAPSAHDEFVAGFNAVRAQY